MHTFAQKPKATQQTTPGPAISTVNEVLRSPGQPLDAATRAAMEPRFGHDFSKVRVHTDARADESADAINASAYTVGPQIVFGAGQYLPGTTTGQQLLAHELTHVAQQRGQPSAGHSLAPGSDVYEAEAERAASTATSLGALHTTEQAPGVIQRDQRQKPEPIRAQPHTQGNTGRKSKRLLVILWDPHRENQGPRPTPQQMGEAIFGSQPTSLREFYRNQSGGQEAIDKVAVLGWYDAKKPADHYWNHPKKADDGYDDGHNEKWAEALQDADSEIDFKSFDDNHDGKLTPDELAILIVIPQKIPFGTSLGVPLAPKHAALVLDGVQIGPISEVYMPFPINAGVIRHELGHLLFDFPDTYANKKYPGHGADDYSIMASSYTDAQIDAPTRIGKGWVNDNPITHSGTYAIGSIEDTHEAFTFTRPGSKPREYFAIEKRVAGKYDKQLPQGGLVIWRKVDSSNPEDLYRFTPGGKPAWPMDQPLNNLVLNWSDGKDSGVRISVDPKMQGMAFTIEIPAASATPARRP